MGSFGLVFLGLAWYHTSAMPTEHTYTDVIDDTKELLEEYWLKKEHRLDKLLASPPPDAILYHVHVVHFAHHNAYRVSLHVAGSGGLDVRAEETSHDPHKAMDLAVDRVVAQIRHSRDRQKPTL